MKLVSIFSKDSKQQRLWNLAGKKRAEREKKISRGEIKESNTPIQITAYLNRAQYNLVLNGSATIEIPNGVSMTNKRGTRILEFACENETIADVLIDGLDRSGISWEETIEDFNPANLSLIS